MKSSFYRIVAKYKTRLIMASKVVFVLSVVLFLILIFPQIYSQKEDLEIVPISCNNFLEEPYMFDRIHSFYGAENVIYECDFLVNLTNKSLELSSCNISFHYINDTYQYLFALTDEEINDLYNEQPVHLTQKELPPFYHNNYVGSFVITCDGVNWTSKNYTLKIQESKQFNEEAILRLQNTNYQNPYDIQVAIAWIGFWGAIIGCIVGSIITGVIGLYLGRRSKK